MPKNNNYGVLLPPDKNMSIKLSSKVTAIPGTHITEINQSAVALNLNNENYYGLNSTAFQMYQALITSNNIEQALAMLKDNFLIPEEELKSDLLELIKELELNGLIKLS